MSMKKNLVTGLFMLAFGIFSLYWAQTHSPDSGIGVKVGREISGSYSLSTAGYIFSLVFGTALTVMGGLRAWKAK